ncbi:MAG: gluconate 2-dehydrogenase subunit 3 family protein [Pseudomonadota bacterium]
MSDVSHNKLNRRAMLLGAVLLVGGAAALTRFARKPVTAAGLGPALSTEQFALLEQVCEVIIPTTDTPGAIVAGVPGFVREMLEEWGSATSRAEVSGVLEAIEQLAWSRFGAAFLELSVERRLEVVGAFDVDRIGRQEPAYGKFKYLVLVGYYQSEVGATQELRFELVPGAWRSCVPLSEIGRASAV